MTETTENDCRRLRIASVVIQPVLMWDDGDELTPGPEVQAVTVPLSQLADVIDRLPAEVERIASSDIDGVQ